MIGCQCRGSGESRSYFSCTRSVVRKKTRLPLFLSPLFYDYSCRCFCALWCGYFFFTALALFISPFFLATSSPSAPFVRPGECFCGICIGSADWLRWTGSSARLARSEEKNIREKWNCTVGCGIRTICFQFSWMVWWLV